MILSTNVVDKENEDKDSSSEDSIKDEGLSELKNIMEINRKSNLLKLYKYFKIIDNEKEQKEKNENNANKINPGDSSKNLTNIEFKNQSINSSLKSLSHGEEFIQNDILQVLNNPQKVSIYYICNFFRKKIRWVKIQ